MEKQIITPTQTTADRFRERFATKKFAGNILTRPEALLAFIEEEKERAYKEGLAEEVDLEESGYLKVRVAQAKQETREEVLKDLLKKAEGNRHDYPYIFLLDYIDKHNLPLH